MADDAPDRDDLEARLDRLESTLEELRDAVVAEDRLDHDGGPTRAAERALRLTERLAVPAAVAALEANVRVLEFLQDRLEAVEDSGAERRRDAPVSTRLLDRLDEAIARMDDAIAEADLPRDAEARRLLERARELNAEVRDRARSGSAAEPTVIEIDVEEELDRIKDDVADEDDES